MCFEIWKGRNPRARKMAKEPIPTTPCCTMAFLEETIPYQVETISNNSSSSNIKAKARAWATTHQLQASATILDKEDIQDKEDKAVTTPHLPTAIDCSPSSSPPTTPGERR